MPRVVARPQESLPCPNIDHTNPYWTVVFDDDDLHVRVNPAAEVSAIHVTVASLISRPSVAIVEWDEWIASGPQGRHAIEVDAMRAVWPRLRALGSATQMLERAQRPLDDALRARIEHHVVRGLCRAWGWSPFPCPKCGVLPCFPRFVDRLANGEASFGTCRRCDHPLDVDALRHALTRANEKRERRRLR